MVDTVTRSVRSWIMSRIRSANTGPERTVRRSLRALGYRYRSNRRDLPGKPDVTLVSFRVAILIHGCFWHGHRCSSDRRPRSNREYWRKKVESNRTRDARVLRALHKLGWETLVVWECSTQRSDFLEHLRSLLQRKTQRKKASGPCP